MEKESLPRLRRAIPKGCSSRRGLRYAQKKGLYKNHIAEVTESTERSNGPVYIGNNLKKISVFSVTCYVNCQAKTCFNPHLIISLDGLLP